MFSLIRGEIYRLLRKKSLYIYFGALAAGYFVLAFIRSNGFNEESIVNDALSLFSLLPALAGGFLFAAIYADDLNSKNLISLVGFGVNKATIVIVKLILAILFGTIIFGIIPLYHFAVYAIFGQTGTASITTMIYATSVKYLLTVIAYCALSGIVVYGLQRATFAIVSYILLAFGVVGSLVSVALNTFAPSLVKHLISGITDRILIGMISGGSGGSGISGISGISGGSVGSGGSGGSGNGGLLIMPVIEYIVFVLIAVTLSIIAFHKKEMEF